MLISSHGKRITQNLESLRHTNLLFYPHMLLWVLINITPIITNQRKHNLEYSIQDSFHLSTTFMFPLKAQQIHHHKFIYTLYNIELFMGTLLALTLMK